VRQSLEELGVDVLFALRQLRRAPAFAIVALVTLALGIGVNSAIFALADAALLQPLPFANPDRLVFIEEHGPEEAGRSRIELLNLREWIAQTRTVEAMAAVWIPASGGGSTIIGPDGTPETVPAQRVTAGFFDVLGVRPVAGRTFRPEDDAADQPVVVLSERFWRARFGADPAVVGRAIRLDDGEAVVVGVADAAYFTPDIGSSSRVSSPSLWTLLPRPVATAEGPARGQCGSCRFLQVVGRLKPGATRDAAQAELTAMAEALAVRNDGQGRPRHVTVSPLRDRVIGRDVQLTSVLLMGIVGFVLLLSCANVANLLLARATGRTRELAIRTSVGAGRWRIIKQLVTESVVLAAFGGLLGAVVGVAALSAAPAIVPPGLLPAAMTVHFDARVALFCAAASLVVGVLSGLAPVRDVTGGSLAAAIMSDSRTVTRGGGVRAMLAAAEVAAAVIVLCGAGLLLRTLLVVDDYDPGYKAEPNQVLTLDFVLPGSRYGTAESRARFYDAIEQQLSGVTGVRSAAWATTLPFGGSQLGRQSFAIVGDLPAPTDSRPDADIQVVSASYFQTMDLPIVAGRPFTGDDRGTGTPVCLVNEAFVRRHLRGRNPLGTRLAFSDGSGPVVREIVGVVRQVKRRPDEQEDFVQIYLPIRQAPSTDAYLLVRGTRDGASLAQAVRQAVGRVDPVLPVRNVVTLEQVTEEATSRYSFRALLAAAFGTLALILAMVGVFGVLAYSVEQRTREFGVRMALGATTGDVVRLVFGSAARVIAAGVATGLAAGAALAHTLSTFLFGVPPLDPPTFAGVVLVIGVTAALAVAAPSLRATRVDPVEALRGE
jgi:putative ABC transport system permease protein